MNNITQIPLHPLNYLRFSIYQGFVNENQSKLKTPLGLNIFGALTPISLVCQDQIDVCIPIGDGLIKPTSLYLTVVAASGERKSAIYDTCLEAIKEFESEQRVVYEKKLLETEMLLSIWEAKRKVLSKLMQRKLLNKENFDDEQNTLLEHMASKPTRPVKFKMIYQDVTSEAFTHGLSTGFPSAGLISSEGSSITTSPVFNDMATLNATWSGETVTVDRKTAESYTLENVRTTVSIAIQPEMLDKYLDEKGDAARGSGLLARCLFCEAGTTQGSRFIYNNNASNSCTLRFKARLTELMELNLELRKDKNFKRKVIYFNQDAKLHFINYCNWVESQIQPGGRYAMAGDHASKLAETVARLAALLHYFEGFEGDISLATLEGAIKICDASSFDFVKRFTPLPQDHMDAALLGNWLQDRRNQGQRYIPRNYILQFGPNPLRDKKRLHLAINILAIQKNVALMRNPKKKFFLDIFPWLQHVEPTLIYAPIY